MRKGLSSRLAASQSGVAVIEFALLAPLMLMLFALLFELGRMALYYQQLNSFVDGTIRWSARYPQFDSNVRQGVTRFASIAAPPGYNQRLSLTLRSVRVSQGTFVNNFAPYNFFGDAQNVPWQTRLQSANFKDGEIVIVVSARYRYDVLFKVFGNFTFDITDAQFTNPFYSRSYDYNTGVADLNYFNVR